MQTAQPVAIASPAELPAFPVDQRPLAELHCTPLASGAILQWSPARGPATLAFSSAFDHRDTCRATLVDPDSDFRITLDADYASHAQRFHLRIPAGVSRLRVQATDGPAPLWLINDPTRAADCVPTLWPDDDAERWPRFFRRLEVGCVAQFGWMGGCVTEAYDALAQVGDAARWNAARDRWLDYFLDAATLRYQGPRGEELTDRFNSIETPLPITAIARARPEHSCIDHAVSFMLERCGHRGVSCEGCYTFAYPLLQVGIIRGRDDLCAKAADELTLRRELLVHNDEIYLRHHLEGRRNFPSWARGIAWYLLGHANCLRLAGLKGRWAQHADHFAERCRWALAQQRPDGLWNNFRDDPLTPPDTSGSAGIAAAVVAAQRLGLLGPEAEQAARRCWTAAQSFLAIDGWLTGVAMSNKRDEAYQRGPFRCAIAFGQGMLGLLAAALGIEA